MIIGVVSGKGGVGKTTTVANLSVALASVFKKRVLAVDCNPSSPDLPIHLGLYPYPRSPSKRLLGQPVYRHPSGADLMPCQAVREKRRLGKRDLRASGYDFVMLDAPPVGDEPVLKLSDAVLVVTNPDVPAVADALRAVERAEQRKLRVLGVEVNRAGGGEHEISHAELVATFDTPVIAIIPESARLQKGVLEGVPIVSKCPFCKSTVEFEKLAAFLAGEEYRVSVLHRVFGVFLK